jgi:hypothetical protein
MTSGPAARTTGDYDYRHQPAIPGSRFSCGEAGAAMWSLAGMIGGSLDSRVAFPRTGPRGAAGATFDTQLIIDLHAVRRKLAGSPQV